ncbi:MAG: tripartite tricarboxylate transporter substrate binding protein [Proteobacteria bacterium]|nr:tripartite tricarboxylate transporter substrate binding protein [Pseudomonadota bacterium]
MIHRWELAALALLAAGAVPAQAQTDTFPTHAVRIVLPFAAGGPTDIVARVIGNGLTELWKQQVVVDNRTGAGGNIGAELVAKAPGDGYTLLVSTPSLAVAPAVYKKLAFRPLEDFAPIAKLGVTPTLLIVAPQLGVDSVHALIARAKAAPGQLSFASPGPGTSLHLAAELFKRMAAVDILHVPYRGGAPALIDIMAGQPQMMFNPLVDTMGHLKTGKLKALAVSTRTRTPVMPELPTVSESGVPGYDFSLWYAVFAPAATPPALVARINRDVLQVLGQDAVKERFESVGIVIAGGSAADFAAEMRREVQAWTELATSIGLSLD